MMSHPAIARYRILDPLGEGGMGIVYRAEDTTLMRQVALKFLPGEATIDQQLRLRFLREARIAAALNHPNICTIYEVGEVGSGSALDLTALPPPFAPGTPFIAMELVEGTTLRAVLDRSGAMPLEEILDISLQVAEGLAAAHARNIIHRDLKPQNVMVTLDGRVKILDFGLAKLLERSEQTEGTAWSAETLRAELTLQGQIIGTVAHMSPEQALGKKVDARSDVFSFGIMLYEMAAGERPFLGESPTSTIAKILEAEPAPLPSKRSDLPPEFERVVERCLQKKPENRYENARDLVVALRAVRSSVSAGSPRTLTPPPSRPLVTRKMIAAGTIVAALAIALLVADPVHRFRPSPPAPAHRQMTFVGNTSYPAIAPDGTFFAYVAGQPSGLQRVMVQDMTGGGELEILSAESASELRWSPDGSRLAVFVVRDDKLQTCFVPRLGGVPQFVAGERFQSWSPDGEQFAAGFHPSRNIHLVSARSGRTAAIPLAGSVQWLGSIDWSPAGNLLLFLGVDERDHYSIWTTSLDGKVQHQVIEDSVRLFSPRWSPGGEAIYYLRAKEDTKEIWKVPVQSTGRRSRATASPLLTGLEAGDYFTLSKDGERLIYTRKRDFTNLWRINLEGPGPGVRPPPRQLTTGTFLQDSPSISPDGSRVAFSRGDAHGSNIFVLDLDDGALRQLTFMRSSNEGPVWSPDGKRIAFWSTEGTPNIWTVDAAGGVPHPLESTRPSAHSSSLCWQPGSRIFYPTPGNRNFKILDPDSSEESFLLADESLGWIFDPVVSPDGRSVAVFWNRVGPEADGLWLISLEDGSQTSLMKEVEPLVWAHDGGSVYAIDALQLPVKILRIAVPSGEADTVVTFPPEWNLPAASSPGVAVNLQTGIVICAVAEAQSEVWMVEHFDPDLD